MLESEYIPKFTPRVNVNQTNINNTSTNLNASDEHAVKISNDHTTRVKYICGTALIIFLVIIGIILSRSNTETSNNIQSKQVQGTSETKQFETLTEKISKHTIEEYFNRTKSEYVDLKTPEFKYSSLSLLQRCQEIGKSNCNYDAGNYGNFKSISINSIYTDSKTNNNNLAYNKLVTLYVYFIGEIERNDKTSSKFGITGYFNFVVTDKINDNIIAKFESNKNEIQNYIKITGFDFVTSCVDRQNPTANLNC
jgi:hypothetical protein